MRQAILSDIHGNLVALQAVLADLEKQKVDEIVCLGDVVGYGPRPRECLRVAFDFRFTLKGNHEDAVLNRPEGFNEKARRAILWTHDALMVGGEYEEEDRRIWNFLGGLPDRHQEGDTFYAHGSPRPGETFREYIFFLDCRDQRKMNEVFASFDGRVCFVGHTHIPGIFEDNCTGDGYYSCRASSGNSCYELADRKVLVNVGSVGQPRDGDPRACYVIYDMGTVRFRRVPYDVEKAIQDFAGTNLPAYLARRLREGK